MLTPRQKPISILSLGTSVGTDKRAITSEVTVVKTFEELDERSHEVNGKIVVYNYDYQSYGRGVKYRDKGASEAAKYGSVAALVINC
jgi:carboxypeptidase Q